MARLNQEDVEILFNKKQLKQVVLEDLESLEDYDEIMSTANKLYSNYLEQDTYESKRKRMYQLSQLDSEKVINNIIATAVTMQQATPYVSVASMCAQSLGFEHKADAILTCCEILAVLAPIGLYEFTRFSKQSQMNIISRIEFDAEVMESISKYMYLPPMVSKPQFLHTNASSPYYTIGSDSLILGGSINHHSMDICLDVLNTQNQIKYVLDDWFINNFTHEFESELTGKEREEAQHQHETMLKQTEAAIEVLDGRPFYLPNKYDKRGRMYSQGYHINTQGSEYKKCMINLEATCIVEVPESFL